MENYIKRFYDIEKWSNIEMPDFFASKFTLEVSNYGKVKRTSKETQEEVILKQFLTEGYPQAKFTILEKISEKDNLGFIETRKQILELEKELKNLIIQTKLVENHAVSKSELLNLVSTKQSEIDKIKKNYKAKYKKNVRMRKKNFSNLVHRLVATCFVEIPSEEHCLVAHLDYDKSNNHHSNLKWMTRSENVKHQLSSPFVVKSKIKALNAGRVTRSKLTTSQVSILKKRMNEGVSLSELAKRYPVTQTQLLRIKRGENWAKVPAAM